MSGYETSLSETANDVLIDSGQAWFREGHVGRVAIAALHSGAAVLPVERHRGLRRR
jgi:hypothetical protein